MASPTAFDEACSPTRIVSGALHHVDAERTRHVHGKKNEWDVVARAFRRYLAGEQRPPRHVHFTEAPGVCPVATPVDFDHLRAIVYQCGLPVAAPPTPEIGVVRLDLSDDAWTFFLASREEARHLGDAWAACRAGRAQERWAWGASAHTGTLLRRTWLVLAFDRVQGVTHAPLAHGAGTP